MVSGGRFDATQFSVLFTVGLTVAVLVHLLFVQMLNEQVVQKKDSQYRATLEQERAEALMESYTTQRRLTHEFSNHLEALSLMLQQNERGRSPRLPDLHQQDHSDEQCHPQYPQPPAGRSAQQKVRGSSPERGHDVL